jgi:hypothetical protein
MTRKRWILAATAVALLVGAEFARFERRTWELCALCGTPRTTDRWGFGVGDAVATVHESESVRAATYAAALFGADHVHVWRVDSCWTSPACSMSAALT